MGVFDNFPYTNIHDLNTDWLVKTVKEVKDKADLIDQSVSDARQYADNAKTSEENAKTSEDNASAYADNAHQYLYDVEDYTNDLSRQVNENTNNIAVNSSRIDTFTNLPVASTAGDAELMDIRVGYDGVTYNTAGDAVRGQVGDLHNMLSFINMISSKNLYDSTYHTGYFVLPTDGVEYVNASYSCTDYIAINQNDTDSIVISTSMNATNLAFRYALYDEDKTWVSGDGPVAFTLDNTLNRYYLTLALTPDVKYLKFSAVNAFFTNIGSGVNAVQVENNTTITKYEPYFIRYPVIDNSALEFKPEMLNDLTFGVSPLQQKSASFVSGQTLVTESNSIMKNQIITFFAKLGSFDTIYIGHGQSTYGFYIRINNTNIAYMSNGTIGSTFNHGLTISDFINVILSIDEKLNVKLIITTAGGSFEKTAQINMSTTGNVFVTNENSTLTDAVLTWSSNDYKKPIWCFGDSYFTLYSPSRWPYYVVDEWNYDTMLLNGYPGANAQSAYDDLNTALLHGTPKYLLWCIGMNNPDTGGVINADWQTKIENIMTICQTKGIELILTTIPTVPSVNNNQKNTYIRNSGYRYVDIANIVSGVTGWLSDDNVHPSVLGGRLIASGMISGCPELLQN